MKNSRSGRSIEERSKNHRTGDEAIYDSTAYADRVSASSAPIKETTVSGRAKASASSTTTKSNKSWWRSRRKADRSSRNTRNGTSSGTDASTGTETEKADASIGTETEKTPTASTETTKMKRARETEGMNARVRRTADRGEPGTGAGEPGTRAGSKGKDSAQFSGRKTTHNRYIVFKDNGFGSKEEARSEKYIINKIENEGEEWRRRRRREVEDDDETASRRRRREGEDNDETASRSAADESHSNNNAERNRETSTGLSDRVFFERRLSFDATSRRRRRMSRKNQATDFVPRR